MQEQVTITTPVTGKPVVLKGYVTGRVEQEIQGVLQSHLVLELDPNTNQASSVKIPASAQQEANNKAVSLLVISVDGKTDNVLDAVLDLPAQDTKFIIEEVNKITAGLDEKKSSNLSAPTSSPSATAPAA